MGLIGNLIVNLQARTAAFDKGMKKSRKHVSAFGREMSMLKSQLATGIGLYAAGRFVKSSVDAYLRQEDAVNRLRGSLRLLGKDSPQALKQAQKFASGIQSITTYGDEAILELMALGSSMGKLSGRQLEDATRAAIGLAEAYGIELTAAMRLVARAAVGDTAQLKRYGITIKEGLPAQEKFNALLKIGAANFRLAEDAAKSQAGKIKQLRNAWGDFTEKIGAAVMNGPLGKALNYWTQKLETIEQRYNRILAAASKSGDKLFGIDSSGSRLEQGKSVRAGLVAQRAQMAQDMEVLRGNLGIPAFRQIYERLAAKVEGLTKQIDDLDNTLYKHSNANKIERGKALLARTRGMISRTMNPFAGAGGIPFEDKASMNGEFRFLTSDRMSLGGADTKLSEAVQQTNWLRQIYLELVKQQRGPLFAG